jgi:hypothetical protein
LLALAASAQIVRVEVAGTHAAELPGARPLVFVHPLAGVPPAAVRSRARVQAATWLAESWERFARDPAAAVFGSVESRAHGVVWPAARAFLFAHPPERPAKAGSQTRTDPYGLYAFPVPAAGVPASADPETRLRGAAPKKSAAPAIRPDARTVAAAAPLGVVFYDSGAPRETSLFEAVLRVAMMPQGVFHYVEIEDHDDNHTWSRAPSYGAELLMPASGCGVRPPARMAAPGYFAVFAGPHPGNGAHVRVYGEFPPAAQVALAEDQVELMAMDFAAIAEAGSSRWRLPFKKTAMFT